MDTQQVLAACDAAFAAVHTGANRWTIGNDLIAKTVEWQPEIGLSLSAFANRQTGHCWQPDLAAENAKGSEFSLCWNGELISARQATELRSVQAEAGDGAVTLQFDLRLRAALDVSLFYQVHSRTAVIEQWLEVTPLQAGDLSHVAPLLLCITPLPSPTVHWVRGLQGHGWHMPASGPYPAYQVCHQSLGEVSLESGLRSTWNEVAWLALDSNATPPGAAPPPRGGRKPKVSSPACSIPGAGPPTPRQPRTREPASPSSARATPRHSPPASAGPARAPLPASMAATSTPPPPSNTLTCALPCCPPHPQISPGSNTTPGLPTS